MEMQGLGWLVIENLVAPATAVVGCFWKRKARRMTVPETAAMAVAKTIPFEAKIDDMTGFLGGFCRIWKIGEMGVREIEKRKRRDGF